MATPEGAAARRVAQPIRLNRLELRNRLFMPAHTTNYGDGHLPTERHLAYHRERARGGVGMIIFESIRTQQNSLGRPQGVAGFDPRAVEPFRRIARAVQGEGAKLLGQVIHLGRQIDGDFERTCSWGPSPVPWAATAPVPHAIDEDEMARVIEGHLATTRHLLEAGFDGIELQMGHGHLLQQFLSPASNRRDDAYGGADENRMRFPIAVLRALRDLVGPDVCLGIRFSAEEFLPGGLDLAMACRMVPAIAAAVPIDFVNVSHSAYHGSYSLGTQMADMGFGPTPFRHLPAAVRAALHAAGQRVPVLAVCRFRGVDEAEDALARGEADMVGMARAHVAEPALIAKGLDGRGDEIRPCIGCNQGCATMLEKNLPITCLVNPRAGREAQWPEPWDDPAPVRRRVLVVGGGPAGLECAWVAAARGHAVTLVEASDRLGGQLRWLERMPQRREFLALLDHQERRCARHGVRIERGTRLDAAAILARGADAIVLATGSLPSPSALDGDRPVLGIEDALADPAALGPRVAFYDTTGEWASVGAIEHLASIVDALTVFTPVAGFGWRTTIYSTLALNRRLRARKVRIRTLRRALRWDAAGLTLEDVSTGETETLAGFDTLIATQYNRAEDGLAGALKAQGVTARLIGDCLAPRTALEAVFEGHAAARAI